MAHLVDIAVLPAWLRRMVKTALAERLLKESTLLTYREAGALYGYAYQTLRYNAHHGQLRTVVLKNGEKRVTHGAIRRFADSRQQKISAAKRQKDGVLNKNRVRKKQPRNTRARQ